ncbi:MAG: hypothetical protein SGILL_002848, partial [Bacillariaceae sp.]
NDSKNSAGEIESLKSNMNGMESEIAAEKEQNEQLRVQISDLTKANKDISSHGTKKSEPPKPEVDHPKPDDTNAEETAKAVSDDQPQTGEEVETLKRDLKETASSLENAKKMIASVEHANGSLASDLRSNLKSKEEELAASQKESDERKRRLDSLATELRDLQRRQGDVEGTDVKLKSQIARQKAFVGHLQTSISDLQAAIVVHEASISAETGAADKTSIEEISEILADALNAMNETLQSTEGLMEDADDVSDINTDVEVNSEVGRHIDAIIRNDREAAAKQLRSQLDQKRIAVKRLEEALKKQHQEMKRMRAQIIGSNGGKGGESDEQLRAEIQSLRQQCSTNMEVLAKKERELSVLRSSLKVDDNDAGYISDDASDDEEEDNTAIPSPSSLENYGPADAEALATILSQTSGGIEMPGRRQEVQTLREQLLKALGDKENASNELKADRESLANAKMIISSLEKANKGMMEDLRSRLQESNTAIASLLDKSMEHEKNAERYQKELEQLKQERLEEQEKISQKGGDNNVIESGASTTDPATEEKKEDETLTVVI